LAEKERALWKKADEAELATLLLEAMLLGSVTHAGEQKENDLIALAVSLYKVDTQATLSRTWKEEKAKRREKSHKPRRSANRAAK
jgi:hypothetical protein